ncbi:glutamate racemase [Synechocystis sp. PCC 7339]|uniref:glutamate racemase n=1 Tax=unclassified Synechocystis TaxID=2640012 RepID=UPI001BB0804C|nr:MULTISPECIES: glutamate racemase [unclassified Synechocystis]QUS59278.1 glutamate racemase [Synechocystis sp. PCC 7338]UAJ71466.1 glutamate racemase [Synechocystis sp. PCC 7339]
MREPQRSRIGVFDSGVGGLTVLRELYRQLPKESILYFGDTARLPYGNRSPQVILQYVREILTWMTEEEVKMVIMACNTSSALALETVQQEFNMPILGVILPGARAAVRQGRRIGVISTPATAASNAYRHAIHEVNPDALVWQMGCPEFVPLIEQNRLHDPYTLEVAKGYLQPLLDADIDTLVFGCTHYRHLTPVFQQILPSHIRLVDPASHVVKAARQELEVMGLRNSEMSIATRFTVSGCPQQFAELSQQWLGFTPMVEKISLPCLSPIYPQPLEIRE